MRVALITGRETVDHRDVPEPTPAADGVVVDIAFCGICGTDVHAYTSGRDYPPAVCGHEWAGVVSARGADVASVAEGDRVIVSVPDPCGSCAACEAGHHAHCTTVLAVATGRDAAAASHGGFAPRIAVRHDRVMAAHPDLAMETLAQVEPVTISLHAVRRSGIRPGDLAVVQGAGPVGLTTLQCVRAADAGAVVVVEPDPTRRGLAERMGADIVVAPADAESAIAERSSGLGADVVYECVGHADTIQSAVDLARKGGTMALIGLADGDATITPGRWLRKEITVVASVAYTRADFAEAQDLIADGRIDLAGMHTSTIGLDELSSSLDALAAGRTDDIKVLVDPTV